jgi:hypothetical protein
MICRTFVLIGLMFYISLIYFSYNDNNLFILVVFTLFALLKFNNANKVNTTNINKLLSL